MIDQKRSFSNAQTYGWTAVTLSAVRTVMDDHGFHEIVPAILSSELEPGAFHSYAVIGDRLRPDVKRIDTGNIERQVTVTGKESYYLPVSHNFEKQQATEFLGKVYCLAPCVRLLQKGEASSRKHLNTFFQIEVELKTESMEEVMRAGEDILVGIATYLSSKANDLIDINTVDAPNHIAAICKGDFPRITFAEALELVGAEKGRETDLTFEEDQGLSKKFDRPFWIHNYPKGVRDAVYHENSEGNYDTYDLMLPFGYGELATGGIRPKTGEAILAQSLSNLGEPENTLTHGHAEWKRNRKIQTAGFGIGFERLLRFISGSRTVLDFVQPHDHGPNRIIPGMK
ncbi:amino acid--tRNA ligase-related protein [Rhizobium paknamense]|uniref:Aspartyl/asparaginyl-tRNA synthetase n=1 Tax=Rhizobium paknamense TaxID=1206817 RepID=A0ABU0IAF0_9HYPH|nr:amino acid--tRNA ligase-related protein [Rhizobium paknamense]MDQ0455202.1 aspartyl/asparaginyl-tRNA synthetase [Rhizobium paknamense]